MRNYDEFVKVAANYADGIKTLRRKIPFDKKFDIVEKAMLSEARRIEMQKPKRDTMSGYEKFKASGKNVKNSVIINNAINKLDSESRKRAYALQESLNNQTLSQSQ